MGKVILVASGKGGTGKTMFSSNLGGILAEEGSNVVIVDADMGQRNLDLYLGLENRVVYDAYDVMTGVCTIDQALIRDKRFTSLYIMAASPASDNGELTPVHVKNLCDNLRQSFDYVIIDGPSGIEQNLRNAAAGADAAIIVTVPEYSSLRDADILDRMLLGEGLRERYYVLNKVMVELMKEGYGPSLKEIAGILMPELLGIIQFDENIFISTTLGVPIVFQKDTYIKENFKRIANRIK